MLTLAAARTAADARPDDCERCIDAPCNNWEIGMCCADINGDGVVNDDDLDLFMDALVGQACGGQCGCVADLNRDGVVDECDICIMQHEYNTCEGYSLLPLETWNPLCYNPPGCDDPNCGNDPDDPDSRCPVQTDPNDPVTLGALKAYSFAGNNRTFILVPPDPTDADAFVLPNVGSARTYDVRVRLTSYRLNLLTSLTVAEHVAGGDGQRRT
ncbi:MAG: hypothetical protein H3C42_14990 [Phycisphaerae bacterium]|nr:hypothetical protein [Phycisphaerae bacterium]NUQ48600.1 hypothetical protein [Phycisphaerae bacterium]